MLAVLKAIKTENEAFATGLLLTEEEYNRRRHIEDLSGLGVKFDDGTYMLIEKDERSNRDDAGNNNL